MMVGYSARALAMNYYIIIKKILVNMGLFTIQKRIKSEEFQQVSSDSKMIETIDGIRI